MGPQLPAIRRRPLSRFVKSFKYKHKRQEEDNKQDINLSCDKFEAVALAQCRPSSDTGALIQARLLLTLLLVLNLFTSLSVAYCPAKCQCDDQLLSVNCTQAPNLTIVPMTLNPLLKRLTLNQLAMSDLSNSLGVYRQLEYLNLNSNQLRQVRYSNFNFRPAPAHLSVVRAQDHDHDHQQQHANQAARVSLERLLLANNGETNGESFRLHLRELLLSDNKIEQIGDLGQSTAWPRLGQTTTTADYEHTNGHKIAPAQLELAAPFLTLNQLELLDLSGNKLRRIAEHAFFGLLNLKVLDLSRNELEHVDNHALVGLVELRELRLQSNQLGGQHQLGHLGIVFCRAPLMELKQLDLSNNQQQHQSIQPIISQTSSNVPQQQQQQLTEFGDRARHVLPRQMFACTPKLSRLDLASLGLRHVHAQTLDGLKQLDWLNLSSNPIEQVPSDLVLARSDLGISLRTLDLSNTLIEFVSLKSSNSFGALRSLETLHLNSMSRLVSFDLAALSQQQQSDTKSSEPHNTNLKALYMRNNKRLQSVHSSLVNQNGRILFEQLRLLDLAESSELREISSPSLLLETRTGPLRVDLTHSTSLNCSSCQMVWLIELARTYQLTTSSIMPELNTSTPELTSSFGLYGSRFVRPSQQQAFTPFGSSQSSSIELVRPELIGCAWPFSMPLLELLSLEIANYAPLFPQANECAPHVQINNSPKPSGPIETQLGAHQTNGNELRVTSPPVMRNGQQLNLEHVVGPKNSASHQNAQVDQAVSTGSLMLAAFLLACLALLGARVVFVLLARHKRAKTAGWLAGGQSPSLTTSSAVESPSSTNSSSVTAEQQQQQQQRQHGKATMAMASHGSSALVLGRPHYYGAMPTTPGYNFAFRHSGNNNDDKEEEEEEEEEENDNNSDGIKNLHFRLGMGQVCGARGNLFSRFAARLSGAGGSVRALGGARSRAQPSYSVESGHTVTSARRRVDGVRIVATAQANVLQQTTNRIAGTTRMVVGGGCHSLAVQTNLKPQQQQQNRRPDLDRTYNICAQLKQPAAAVYDYVECAPTSSAQMNEHSDDVASPYDRPYTSVYDSTAGLIYANCQQQRPVVAVPYHYDSGSVLVGVSSAFLTRRPSSSETLAASATPTNKPIDSTRQLMQAPQAAAVSESRSGVARATTNEEHNWLAQAAHEQQNQHERRQQQQRLQWKRQRRLRRGQSQLESIGPPGGGTCTGQSTASQTASNQFGTAARSLRRSKRQRKDLTSELNHLHYGDDDDDDDNNDDDDDGESTYVTVSPSVVGPIKPASHYQALPTTKGHNGHQARDGGFKLEAALASRKLGANPAECSPGSRIQCNDNEGIVVGNVQALGCIVEQASDARFATQQQQQRQAASVNENDESALLGAGRAQLAAHNGELHANHDNKLAAPASANDYFVINGLAPADNA